jgi:hypothetical protein
MPYSNQNPPTAERRGYRIPQFCTTYGIGRSKAYELIGRGELEARKAGKATIITHEAAERWYSSLPKVDAARDTSRFSRMRSAANRSRRGSRRG